MTCGSVRTGTHIAAASASNTWLRPTPLRSIEIAVAALEIRLPPPLADRGKDEVARVSTSSVAMMSSRNPGWPRFSNSTSV